MKSAQRSSFYGWWIVAAALVTLGLSVGIPYYNLPFFYDYFQKTFHWSLKEITLGFPVATVLTLWIPPVVIPRFSPRKLILAGTGLTALGFFGFSCMRGALAIYFLLYLLYTVGYMLAGPIPHQILVSHWFRARRGTAMGFMYVGVGLFGGFGSLLVRSATKQFGFHGALFCLGLVVLLAWPLAMFILRDRPAEMGQFPDGASVAAAELGQPSLSYLGLVREPAFWLLTAGSIASIGSIGSINQHMKFVFRDEGFTSQAALNSAWATASALILWSSIIGRIGIGWLADVFSKKWVMASTYGIVAATILLLLSVTPARSSSLYLFSIVFGFSMGADYMLIPLMAAEQFGVNTLARAMALILPANTLGQTWCPYLVSALRQHFGSYTVPMIVVFAIAAVGALAISIMPRQPAQAE